MKKATSGWCACRHACGTLDGDGGPGDHHCSERYPGSDEQDDHHRRHVPAQRAGVVVCADPEGNEGVLQLHQLPAGQVDGKRGVYGRQIVWKFYDDGYNPANTVQQTQQADPSGQGLRRLSARSAPSTTRRSDRCSTAGRSRSSSSRPAPVTGARRYKQFPWTTGWQPDYVSEGKVYGSWILAEQARARRSRSSTRTTTTGRTTSTASSRGSVAGRT